jgi:hypothetical protein
MAKKSANYAAPLLYKSGLKIPVPDILRLCGPPFIDILWAFEKFHCDPENLVDWLTMLTHFARDLKSRAPGNRTKWDRTNLFILRAAVEEIQRRDPRKTAEQACKELSKREPWRSEGYTGPNLRRRLADARKRPPAAYKKFKVWLRDYVLARSKRPPSARLPAG